MAGAPVRPFRPLQMLDISYMSATCTSEQCRADKSQLHRRSLTHTLFGPDSNEVRFPTTIDSSAWK